MKKLEISDDFTLEDIRLIREYNSKRREKMTNEECIEDINKSAEESKKNIGKYKSKKKVI